MKGYLFSWLARATDFYDDGTVNTDGPNYVFHRYHYAHREHIVLATPDTEALVIQLTNRIRSDFPEHKIVYQYLDVNINKLSEVKSAVERILMDYADYPADIFFSPGSSIMQVAWYLCHTTLNLDTRLVQLLRPEHSQDKIFPDLEEIETIDAPHKSGLLLQQHRIDKKQSPDAPFIAKVQEDAYEKAKLVGNTEPVTAVIYGDSGTGKELIARHIYQNSIRTNKPFRTVNCTAMSDQLLESRLFGHKKGTFTGAISDRRGLFEEADGGMIFLDEIGDISPYMQQALLRVLQGKEIEPVGGKAKTVDVRIITATNKDLYELCRSGHFRWDLYYRLNVAEIYLPPVSQFSASDKRALINYFIRQKRKELHKNFEISLHKKAWERLQSYSFPGNIREVENLIAGLYVLHKSRIELKDLPRRLEREEHDQRSLNAVQRNHIRRVLKETNGNKSQAARILNISLNTLKKKLNEED